MFDLEQVIRERHSTRLFLPQPVPRTLVEEALVLAQHAPSNSDIQPMYLQTLLLALTARGLGSCAEVSIAGHPEIVRAQLAIPTELSILRGLAVGYPDPDFPANKLHIGREAIEKNVVFLDN